MSAKDLISPYLNRFVAINQQKSNARLELCCKDGKVTVNFHHDLGLVEEASPRPKSDLLLPVYSDVLKKNINISQATRLQRRAETRAEEARVETKKQQHIAANAKSEAEKATCEAEKATLEAEEAKKAAEEAKHSAEEAKVTSLKTRTDSEKAITKFKLEAEQAKATLKKHKEAAEKATILANKASELANNQVSKANLEISEDELECEHCHEEFKDKKMYNDHIKSCPICEQVFKEYPYCQQNHIQYDHQELYCDNCGKYFTQLSNMKEHQKTCIKCEKCYKRFKSINKINKHKKRCFSKLLLKRHQAESTDESESHSDKSTDRNESDESSS